MLNIHLALYWGLMILASIVSTWGTFVSLPYEHLGQWEAIKMALPFAWVDWIFLTIAINIGHKHSLATPIQMKFGITMLKFFLIMMFTKYYLKSDISRSDVVGFIIVFFAFLLNEFHGMSILLGRKSLDDIKKGKDDGKEKEKEKKKEETTPPTVNDKKEKVN